MRQAPVQIRQPQMWVLSLALARPFVLEMIEHLRTHFPAELEDLADWELADEMLPCLERAVGHGLTLRRDLARWLALGVVLGWSFDTELPWVAELMDDRAAPPGDRVAEVHERCLRQLEDRARVAASRRGLRVQG